MAKESIKISCNYEIYPYALRCNDIKGIITMHKNSKNNKRVVTTRDIPITKNQRWAFYNERDGWNGSCSYILKSNPNYNYWEQFMIKKYKQFKEEAADVK